MGEPLDRRAVRQDKAALERQADVRFDFPALDIETVRFERPLDVVVGVRLARASGLALPRADRAHVLHQRRRGDSGRQGGLEGIAILPGRRHSALRWSATSSSTLSQLMARRPLSRSSIIAISFRVSGIATPNRCALITVAPSSAPTSVLRFRTARSRQIPVLVFVWAR